MTEESSNAPRGLRALALWSALCAAFLLIETGCSGVPKLTDRLQDGEACRIDWYNARSKKTLVIINESYDDPGSTAKDGSVSRVDDQMARVLVSDYDNLGFFANSSKVPPVRDDDWLAVRSSREIWIYRKPDTVEGRQLWRSLIQGFTAVWNAGDQTVTGGGYGSGKSLLEAERARLERYNSDVKKTLRSRR